MDPHAHPDGAPAAVPGPEPQDLYVDLELSADDVEGVELASLWILVEGHGPAPSAADDPEATLDLAPEAHEDLESVEELPPDCMEDLDDAEELTQDCIAPLPEADGPPPTPGWPRSYAHHLRELSTADPTALAALSALGLGDVRGHEPIAAAILKASADLAFWNPVIGLGADSGFTGHLKDLQECLALLEQHPPSPQNPALFARWLDLRRTLLAHLPRPQAPRAAPPAAPVRRPWGWNDFVGQRRGGVHVTVGAVKGT